MDILFLTTGSPLSARSSFPVFPFLLLIFSIALIIILIWFTHKKIELYHKSEKYIEKEKNRITSRKDVANIAKYYHIPKEQEAILWEICSLTACKNIAFTLKDSAKCQLLFRQAYELMKGTNISDQKLNNFFNLLYKVETIGAQGKGILSTKFLKIGSIVFYHNYKNEQFPLYITWNTNDFFMVEIPEFLYNTDRRPKILEKQRFSIKTDSGISFNFISRIIRYEQTPEKQCLMAIAHTDKLESTIQRHYRREYYSEKVGFSAVRFNPNNKKNDDLFIYSPKRYEGQLNNISAGGCCIEAALPIKENQHICLHLENIGITEKVIGVIKRTRKLPSQGFALHIQFVKISLESKNKLYALVYKYEL